MLLLALGGGKAGWAQQPVPPSDLPAGLPAGIVEQGFPYQGGVRRFLEFQPASLKPGAPVVIVLHGGGQSARKMFRRNRSPHHAWLGLAEREGFLFLAPNGTNPRDGDPAGEQQHWHDIRNNWPPTNGPPDDVGFIAALAQWAVDMRGADPKRIYLAGGSNGGMMTFRLLIERPAVFAAGAAFVATLPARDLPVPEVPRPIMIAAGTDDPVVKWQGGDLLNRGMNMRSAPDTLAYWLAAHGLAGQRPMARRVLPDLVPDDGCRVQVSDWGPEVDAPLVRFWTIRGGGHWIPSTMQFPVGPQLLQWMGPRCLDMDGPAEAWDFLKRQRLP